MRAGSPYTTDKKHTGPDAAEWRPSPLVRLAMIRLLMEDYPLIALDGAAAAVDVATTISGCLSISRILDVLSF